MFLIKRDERVSKLVELYKKQNRYDRMTKYIKNFTVKEIEESYIYLETDIILLDKVSLTISILALFMSYVENDSIWKSLIFCMAVGYYIWCILSVRKNKYALYILEKALKSKK